MAVGWVARVLTCGSMFIAGKWLRAILTSTSCTNHALSNPSIWKEFSLLVTSWPYLVFHLDYSEVLIPWEVTFSLSFYASQRWWVINHLWHPWGNILGNIKIPDVFLVLHHFKTGVSSSHPQVLFLQDSYLGWRYHGPKNHGHGQPNRYLISPK